jgi:ribosomal protein S28E/S33
MATNTTGNIAEDITDCMRNLDVSGDAPGKQAQEPHRSIDNYEATERSIIEYFRSLGNQGTSGMSDSQVLVEKIFSHFDEQIRNIIRKVLGTTREGDLVWIAAKECHKQAASHSGVLHADQYFVPLEETLPGWPYDEDYEDEQFYEHENRLDIDEDYARAFQFKIERRAEDSRKERQIWVDYWADVLSNALARPTTFYPPANPSTK